MRRLIAALAGVITVLALTSPEVGRAQGPDIALIQVLQRLPARPPIPSGVAEAKAAALARSTKIDPTLLQLGDDVLAKGLSDLTGKAVELGILVQRQRVLVMLHGEREGDVGDLEAAVRGLGGEVQTSLENTVFALVPPSAIEQLDGVEPLYYAAPQPRFEARQVVAPSAVAGEGAIASKIERLQKAGIVGKSVKVGILDFGFQGLASLVASGRLPQPKAVRAFGGPSVENGIVHGAACAEIIHAMAPGADLYVASAGEEGAAGNGDIVAAAQWLVSQQVDIISFSGGGHAGPHNGTALLDRVVDTIVQEQGIVWVNAAGNEADAHWGGVVRDKNGDGLLQIDGAGHWGIAIQPLQPQLSILINWDDWGDSPATPSTMQDVDALLFAVRPDGRLEQVAASIQPQRGRGQPLEFINYRASDPHQVFALALRATHVTRPLMVHVYVMTEARLEPRTPVGSIGVPATAHRAIAVGAVSVRKSVLETFSGQGPTDDGRLKPDVSAPDDTSSISYRDSRNPEGRFPGTSAACPHVVGFAALLKQLYPEAPPDRLRQLVIENIRDMGLPGPDNQYGNGHIDGSRLSSEPTGTEGGGGASESDVVEGIPDGFGPSRLTQGDLARLWSMAQKAGERGDLKVVTGRTSYRIGDGLKVGLRSDRLCDYVLVHRDAKGHFSVLAPDQNSLRLEPGARYALPRNETWKLAEPVGREGLMVVCSSGSINLGDWIGNPVPGRVWFATTMYDVKQ